METLFAVILVAASSIFKLCLDDCGPSSSPSHPSERNQYVSGHTRRDGTTVRPYVRRRGR